MLRPRATRRRLAQSHDHELRGPAADESVALLLGRAEAAPGESIVLPPPVPTSSSAPEPTPTGDPVSVPKGLSAVVPVAAALAGALLIAFLIWHFWWRRKQRKAQVNKRSTWHVASKYGNNKEMLAVQPTIGDKPSSSGKPTYPPRKVSAAPRTGGQRDRTAPAPSPLRNQANLAAKSSSASSAPSKPRPTAASKPASITPTDAKPKAPVEAKSPTTPTTAKSPTTILSPISPASPGPTPSETTAFTTPIPRPFAATNIPEHMRFSFLRDVTKLPSFTAQDPTRVQPVKRSASLVSSRMSTKRKPQRQDTAPAESGQPIVPSLRITDTDSPLEGSAGPVHPLEGKMVTVTDPYDSTMPDELTIVLGETLRVVEAYDDDWCLAERVGRKKGRGIVPQICVTEKGGVQANMRFSMLQRD